MSGVCKRPKIVALAVTSDAPPIQTANDVSQQQLVPKKKARRPANNDFLYFTFCLSLFSAYRNARNRICDGLNFVLRQVIFSNNSQGNGVV